jgi:P4 family phage/plasmid primase-like protien
MSNLLLDTALELLQHGISILPVRPDGTKQPMGAWKQYQNRRADPEQARAWFTQPGPGLGIVTGHISGGLEMAEIEGRAAGRVPHLRDVAKAAGNLDLWDALNTGWIEHTPSGGIHWFYRLAGPVPGNTKLATRPSTPDELLHSPKARLQVLAETRGEGGYSVVAPSNGTVHPAGGRWARLAGGPATIPTLTPGDREDFHAILATLTEQTPEPAQQWDRAQPRRDGGMSPGDAYEAAVTWEEILEPAGWVRLYTAGRTTYWRRPGKSTGQSATTGYAEDRDRLYVFTSSTEFDPERAYTKFGAYAVLHHGGDHRAAAAALRAEGYGDPGTAPANVIRLKPFTPAEPAAVGTAALATVHPLPATTTNVTLTDHGNAELLINRHGQTTRYSPARGAWLQWDGTRWAWQEDDGPVTQHCWETIEAIDDEGKEAVYNHIRRSLSRRGIEAAVALTRRDPRIRVSMDQLDARPYELNTPAGIINLTTGERSPADPAKLHTKRTAAPYEPDAGCPGWEKFLHTTFNGDPELTGYFQRLAGYAATGQVTHHILPFLFGPGGNGKSVALDVLIAILGDYATTAPAGFLMAGREHHETEIARLTGMRLVACSEVNQGARFDEAKTKLLTGGDRLTARYMHQNHFTFTPTHTLILMGNHQPAVGAGGESFWRRLRLIPFTHTISEDERIENLAQTLIAAEGPGILNWVVQGAVALHRHGLKEPASVLAATSAYAEEEDALARFITDRCQLGPATAFRINTAHMRREYAQWCREQGEQELTPQQFGRDLRLRHGVAQTRSNGHRYYTGITVFANDPEPPEHWSNQ